MVALDAAGQTIIGPGAYTHPIALSVVGDSNGALSLSKVALTGPTATAVTLTYNATAPLTHASVVASASGASQAASSVNPLLVTPLSLPGLYGGSNAESQTVTLTEYAQTAAYTLATTGAALQTTCFPASCAPAAPGGTVRITLTPTAAGAGTLTLRDTNGTTVTLPYSAELLALYPTIAQAGSVDDVTRGSDGNMWSILDDGFLAKTAPNGSYQTYPLDNWTGTYNPSLVSGPDSAIWYVDGVSTGATRLTRNMHRLRCQLQHPQRWRCDTPTVVISRR